MAHVLTSKVSATRHLINLLLTLLSSAPYWENIALSITCTDRALLGPYQKDLGQLQYSPSTAQLIRSNY